jgi:hypothetical protein
MLFAVVFQACILAHVSFRAVLHFAGVFSLSVYPMLSTHMAPEVSNTVLARKLGAALASQYIGDSRGSDARSRR